MAPRERIGVYPGTFDPITLGHRDIIRRATRIVDKLVIAVAINAGKGPLFTLDERVAMVRAELAALDPSDLAGRVEVTPFDSLLMEFTVSQGARVIIRGLRAVSDFEYEFQMAGMNARLDPDVETVFLMASEGYQFIASRFVKEIGRLGGEVGHFVSAHVAERMRARFADERQNGGASRLMQTFKVEPAPPDV
jgi:pantetheine-phosphate adenylyltransferase